MPYTKPRIKSVRKIEIKNYEKIVLSNKLPCYFVNIGDQDVVKFEMTFSAGSMYQHKLLVAYATNYLINEGTDKKSAEKIAEQLDYYGAYIDLDYDRDDAWISVYTLNKYFEKVMEIVADFIKNANFEEKYLHNFIREGKQDMIIDLKKVAFVASREFGKSIFGDSVYGVYAQPDDFDKLNREDLINFHKKYYTADKANILLVGKITDRHYEILDKYFGVDFPENKDVTMTVPSFGYMPQKRYIEKKDALQSAIKIGKPIFNKTHEDYIPLWVVETALGGYFGSRLMKNLREDKGYTYGVGTKLVSMRYGGFFRVSAEVKKEYKNAAVEEIYKEIEKIRSESISITELKRVKNYILGEILRSVDGLFALADAYGSLIDYGLDGNYIQKVIDEVNNFTPEKFKFIARKYLDPSQMTEIVVG